MLQTEVFWSVLEVSKHSHEILEHHMNFTSQKLSPEVLDTKGNHVAQLVCGKAAKFMSEFSDIFDPRAIGQWDSRYHLSSLSEAQHGHVLELAVLLNCHHAAGYNRRVVSVLSKFPFLLMLLGKRPPEIVCPDRQRARPQRRRTRKHNSAKSTNKKQTNDAPRLNNTIGFRNPGRAWAGPALLD